MTIEVKLITVEREVAIGNDVRFALEQLAGAMAQQTLIGPAKRIDAAIDALERVLTTLENEPKGCVECGPRITPI